MTKAEHSFVPRVFSETIWQELYRKHQPEGAFAPIGLSQPMSKHQERFRRIPLNALRLLGDPLADAGPEIPDWPAFVQELKSTRGWDIAVLSELVLNPDQKAILTQACKAAGLGIDIRLCGRAPIVPLLDEPRETRIAGYSKTLRTRLKRGRKKLATLGEIEISHHLPTESTEVDRLLTMAKSIEDQSWKGAEDTGLFKASRLPFVTAVSHALAAHSQLEFYFLSIDGLPVTYRYGFRDQRRFLDYNLAYLESHARYSPGRVLLDEIVHHSAELGLVAVDASRGSLNRPHILADWPGHIREHYRATLFACTARGRAARLVETQLRPALKSAQSSLAAKRSSAAS